VTLPIVEISRAFIRFGPLLFLNMPVGWSVPELGRTLTRLWGAAQGRTRFAVRENGAARAYRHAPNAAGRGTDAQANRSTATAQSQDRRSN
jgi:hypothetical protein